MSLETVFQVQSHLNLQHQYKHEGLDCPFFYLEGSMYMRKLRAKDIAPFIKILAKMELKESIKSMFSSGNKKENENENENGQMVSELIWGIIENYHKAENEFFEFLASLEDKTKEEISELELSEFIELIKELFSEKNIPFFKFAVK